MQLILLQDVDNVGLRGDVVDVARGYARNYLLPRRLAEEATPARLGELEKRDSHRARHEAATTDQASEIQKVLEKAELRFEMKAGPTGSLFGSVTATDIADELWEKHKVRVDRRKIELPQPIKHVGRYAVPVGIFEDVQAEVATLVLPEGGELPPEPVEEPAAEEPAAEEPAAEAPELARSRGRGARGRGARGRRGAAAEGKSPRNSSSWGQDESCPHNSGYPQGLWRPVECRTNFPRRASFSSTAPSGPRSTMAGTDVLFLLQIDCAGPIDGSWISLLSTR